LRRNDIFYLDKNLYEQKAQHGNQTEFATPAMNRCLEVYLGVANLVIHRPLCPIRFSKRINLLGGAALFFTIILGWGQA